MKTNQSKKSQRGGNLTKISLRKSFGKKLIATVLMVAMMASMGNAMANEAPEDDYVYPTVPGTAEWIAFTTLQEKIDACQIPTEVLTNLSTSKLIEVVLDYPLMINVFAFDDSQTGINSVSSYFNGLHELSTRDDASTMLLEKFKNQTVSLTDSNAQNFQDMMDLTIVKTLLTTDAYYQKLDQSQKIDFQETVASKYNLKLNNPLMYEAETSPYDFSWTVYTPTGVEVPVTYITWELDQAHIRELNSRNALLYPRAQMISTATRKYNCHSYAWYSQSTNNSYWMESPTPYYTGSKPSYKIIPGSAQIGDRAVYASTAHSGIVYSIIGNSVKLKSKWGNGGAYIHDIADSPYNDYSYSITYYR